MREKIKAYLRDMDKPPSLDNIYFDSALYLRRMKEKGHNFEFGKYDWKDGSVEITVELPDPPHVPAHGSQEEWAEKREWYLKNAGKDIHSFIEGISGGYLTYEDDGIITAGICDQLAEWIYSTGSFADYNEEIFLEQQEQTKIQKRKKDIPNPKRFLRLGKKLTYKLIEDAAKFREDILEGRVWTKRKFKEIGFKSPEFSNSAEEILYILDTLNGFIGAVRKRKGQMKKTLLRELMRTTGLNLSLIKESKKNPWEVYETLKQSYCAGAGSPREYDRRLESVVYALGL